MQALIDGDIIVYRSAASAEDDETWIALARADQLIKDILEATVADTYKVYLTGSSNFRRELTDTYKANRPDSRPKHWQAVREFLVTHHKATICEGCEADDMMGADQDKHKMSTTICSIDKDLYQIPGRHYNFVKKEHRVVTAEEGTRHLYLQSLIGDRSDNIIGVQGIGPVKAERALAELETEQELYDKCREMYGDDDRYHLNLKLLYIWRKPNDNYLPPQNRTAVGDSAGASTELSAPLGAVSDTATTSNDQEAGNDQ
jgi:5'-3' exonuclease